MFLETKTIHKILDEILVHLREQFEESLKDSLSEKKIQQLLDQLDSLMELIKATFLPDEVPIKEQVLFDLVSRMPFGQETKPQTGVPPENIN